MKLPEAEWNRDPDMARLLEVLDASAGATRYVGGCVRDSLIGVPVADVDLATRLLPQEVMRRLEAARIKAVPTGLAHGTVTAVLRGRPVEVTTLRRDVSTDGRRATVAFTDDWQEDAARRDFTINALSADPGSGALFDYFDGLADLEARRVRFIGNPLTRIAEDHLRILRFFRFHARFGSGAPNAEGLDACAARANDLMALSRERIAGELLRLLALPDPAPTVTLMVDKSILRPVLPEIDAEGANRLAWLIAREALAGVPGDPLRRLAALLPSGQALGAEMAARLRLSNAAKARLLCIEQERPDEPPQVLAYHVGHEGAVDRLLLDATLDDGEAARRVAALRDWTRPRLPIGGGDIVAAGVQPGPEVARLLQTVEARWVREGFPSESRVREFLTEALAGN